MSGEKGDTGDTEMTWDDMGAHTPGHMSDM